MVQLINEAELHEIRRIWRYERNDWADSVPMIYAKVTGRSVKWIADDEASFDLADEALLQELSEAHGVPTQLVKALIAIEREYVGLKRRSGVQKRLETVLGHEWRTEADVTEDILRMIRAEQGEQPEVDSA